MPHDFGKTNMPTKTPHCECGLPIQQALLDMPVSLLRGRELTAHYCQNCGRIFNISDRSGSA
jgi:hypothetical protein